ncbi:Flap endonuclease GEN 1 [Lobosporangium transversale]|uniref:PIN domain-like protein n=1 Tax=Lobosporangium transversale TaxID=64571 RepID=A0A1Y2GFW3_9FUNG|nr:hypothetical protein BCR41DRAFT_424050 [Lobosporangium transversale]KAF9910020.1 Flap endonuclease GEN 1 [Lobosporangium transversale]ORZ09697.1 hypothetical protein BCR41DRAFT_424050 [Lobosporangium transversale]|eukprot:XP_021878967.1 hypothetical protein BCR41DRAFT_424050 [Lobosporangium transversale]
MGVKGLTALLERLAPHSVGRYHISRYKGKTLAVDVSCYLNRFIYGLDPHPARVQRGVYKLCVYLQIHGIKPIFVFDGPDRIVEKQREIQRRAQMKQKVERSFKLEKVRKSRLKGLKGPAKLLQAITPERASSILQGLKPQKTPLHENQYNQKEVMRQLPLEEVILSLPIPPLAMAKNSNEALREYGLLPAQSQSTLSNPSSLPDIFNVHSENLENDPSWHIPEFTEEDLRKLDSHLAHFEGLLAHDAIILGDSITEHENDQTDSFASDLDTLGQLELNFETTRGLDVMHDLADTSNEDNNTAQDTRDAGGPQPLVPTQAPIEELPPISQLSVKEIFDFADLFGPLSEAEIHKKIHEGLLKYVENMESSLNISSTEELVQYSTKRQKALDELEHKLVKDIKEALLFQDKRKTDPPISQIPLIMDKSVKNEDGSTSLLPDSKSRLISSGTLQEESSRSDRANLFEGDIERLDGKESLTSDLEPIIGEPLMENLTADEQAVWPSEPTGMLCETDDLEDTTKVDETLSETRQDLPSTIKEVLSSHQTLFMTLERRTLRVTWPLVASCQLLLQAMGQPVIQAEGAEAEAICAQLTTQGWADASVSEDTDTAVFGNGILLRQVAPGSAKDIIEINPRVAHESLGINRDAFRDLCILCGTDFSGTIEGIGPNRAVKLIQYYGSIESIMANAEYKPRPDFFYDRARRVFDRVPVIPQGPESYQAKSEQLSLLQELLSKYEIDPDEVKRDLLNESSTEMLENGTSSNDSGLRRPPMSCVLGADPFKESESVF